jgi:hypothetical protein
VRLYLLHTIYGSRRKRRITSDDDEIDFNVGGTEPVASL